MDRLISCEFNMDNACVELKFLDGSMIAIDTIAVENKVAALAHVNVNVKMIDQGSSELNIIIGVKNVDFEDAIKAIYDMFVMSQL